MCSCECFLAALNQPALLHPEVTTENLLGVLVHTCGCHFSWHGSGARYLPGVCSSRAGVSSRK